MTNNKHLKSIEGPYFGDFGGRFVPEALIPALDEFEKAYNHYKNDPSFQEEFANLLKDFVGRPSALTEVTNFAQKITDRQNIRVFLKREDLNHTGAHKINNALGQALLAKRLGKKRVIAETGAGQHGVATATVCALLGIECEIYMGEIDANRQSLNVARMQLLGAKVNKVQTGDRILKDAINEALRDWVKNVENTHYLLGTVAGPHPFPTIVRDFQKIIGEEASWQLEEKFGVGVKPDLIVACVGGGSNAMGIFNAFLDEESVELWGIEAGGDGIDTHKHAIRFDGKLGGVGYFQGAKSYLLQDEDGQTLETHSISAGLDYASIGPEHPFLRDIGRVNYSYATDSEAMNAFRMLSETEGIIPAIESSHALAGFIKIINQKLTTVWKNDSQDKIVIINLSGRGDKDMNTAIDYFGLGK